MEIKNLKDSLMEVTLEKSLLTKEVNQSHHTKTYEVEERKLIKLKPLFSKELKLISIYVYPSAFWNFEVHTENVQQIWIFVIK